MIITSLTNSRIKEICKLKEKKYRNMTNTFLIEGINLVTEAGKRNLLKEIFVLEEKTINIDIPTTYVTKEVMKKISSTDSIPNVVGVSLKKEELLLGDRLLLLDNLQDPGNLGTIIRSSKAFNIDTIVISPTTVDMYNPKVLRATEGMIFHINIIVRDLPSLITELKKDNYKIYGTKVDGGINVKDISLKRKYALVIGNEGNGVSEEVNNLCDGFFYKDKKVAVVGGGSSSLTEALYLSKICKEVIIIHRRDKLTADKYLIDKVNSTKNIKVLYNSNITKYNQNNNKLTSVIINNKDNLEVEGVFLAIGSTPNSEIFNVNKDNNYIIVDSNYMTNIDKVYAIGDVIKKDYYQLSTAASDAVVAASNIIKRENKNS